MVVKEIFFFTICQYLSQMNTFDVKSHMIELIEILLTDV